MRNQYVEYESVKTCHFTHLSQYWMVFLYAKKLWRFQSADICWEICYMISGRPQGGYLDKLVGWLSIPSQFNGGWKYYYISSRQTLFGAFGRVYDVISEDMVEPEYEKYETFMQFFTRSVKPRTFSHDDSHLIAPADSRVLSFAEITKV